MPGTSTRKFIALYTEGCQRQLIYNNSGADLNGGDGVCIAAGTVATVGATNTSGIFGVCCAKIASLAYGWVWVEGVFKATVNGTVDFALGEAVYSAASQTVDKGAKDDIPIGHIVNANPANGATTVDIFICSQLLDRTAHGA